VTQRQIESHEIDLRLAEHIERLVFGGRLQSANAGAVTDLDYSAARTVRDLLDELQAKNVGLAFARVSAYLRTDLDRHDISAKVGEARIFATLHEALAAVRADGSLAGPDGTKAR